MVDRRLWSRAKSLVCEIRRRSWAVLTASGSASYWLPATGCCLLVKGREPAQAVARDEALTCDAHLHVDVVPDAAGVFTRRAHGLKPDLLVGGTGTLIGGIRVEVHRTQGGRLEEVIQERTHGLRPVAPVPQLPLADVDAQIGGPALRRPVV